MRQTPFWSSSATMKFIRVWNCPHQKEDGHGVREQGLSAGEVADILGVDAAWVTARIDGGELRATHPRGSHPGRPVAELCRISERALRVFLMGHAHELDGSAVDLARVIGIMAVRNPERSEKPAPPGPGGGGPGAGCLPALERRGKSAAPCPGGDPHHPPGGGRAGEERQSRCASRPAGWA